MIMQCLVEIDHLGGGGSLSAINSMVARIEVDIRQRGVLVWIPFPASHPNEAANM